MHWALGNDVNSALTLRLPGVLMYTRDVMLPLFSDYMEGAITMDEAKKKSVKGWNDATATQGKINQVQIYRASLGLDGLTEFDLCQLHREEMDAVDNTVCVKYDPHEVEMNYIGTGLRAAGLLLCAVILGLSIGFASWSKYLQVRFISCNCLQHTTLNLTFILLYSQVL